MKTLRLYLPEIVLLVWAAVIWRLGRSDLIVIVGLCVTAAAMWVGTKELKHRYQEKPRHGERHP